MHICVFSRAPLTSERELNARARWATEICMRAGRGSGQAMEAQREAGLMSKGAAAPGNANWQRQRGSESDPRCENERDEPKTITLAEAGIDKHLADKARKFAARGGGKMPRWPKPAGPQGIPRIAVVWNGSEILRAIVNIRH